ncbi:MAG: ATP-dependent helicase [Acidimicrobiales bacterium]
MAVGSEGWRRGAARVPSRRLAPEDLLVGCDAQQVHAITTPANPLCVLAGAGSGKTRVLTRRIAWRVLDGSALGQHVLTLTFTRKAAAELRDRLANLGQSDGVTAGTFHAIALAELRRLAAERRQPPPVVLSSKTRLLHDVLAERLASSSSRGSMARSFPRAAGGRPPLQEVAGEIEWAKSRLVAPSAYEEEAARAGRAPSIPLGALAQLYEAYERERRRRRVLDFEDLLTECAEGLATDAGFAASAQWRFRHVFVDEFQDVNAAQLSLLHMWCTGSGDLCVVGDPDQAIYGWNGSDPAALGNFADQFPGAATVRLSANYRSTGEVLDIANAVLGRSEPPAASGAIPEGPIPTVTAYESDAAEAAGVAELARLAHRPGRTWAHIAVLARTNAQLSAFGAALELRRVPHRALGDARFLRHERVAAALSDLQRAGDASTLARVAADLRSVTRHTGDGEVDAISSAASPEDLADVLELVSLVEEYLATDLVATGAGFRVFLDTSVRGGGTDRKLDAIELATFHRAKGLEWPVVFVTGLEAGLMPITHARDEVATAEEQRLLYVACTRAQEELHCSWARERRFSSDRVSTREPSPYLASIERARRRLIDLSVGSVPAAREALASSRRALAGDAPPSH